MDPVAAVVAHVDLVAVLPLGQEAVSVDATEQFHRHSLVAVLILEQGLADVDGVAPEDGPEVFLGGAVQLMRLEHVVALDVDVGDFFDRIVQVEALVSLSAHLVLEIVPEFVEATCHLVREVRVIDQRSDHFQVFHHILGRPGGEPGGVLVQKVAHICRVVTLLGAGGGNKGN